jgi:hypothetical protein
MEFYMNSPRTVPQRLFDALLRIKSEVLNDDSFAVTQSDASVVIQLKKHTHQIKAEAINPITGQVDYARLRDSTAYREYRSLTGQLPAFALDHLTTREEELAFWLNLYNALIIDGIIHFGIRETVQEDAGFFRRVAYNVGGFRFSADDIEHGILRANAGHPVIPGPQFGKHDPRRRFALEQADFRIHFALVCGAKSCPPVNFYDADYIDSQLDLAARNFLSQDIEIDPDRQIIGLSRLLQWSSSDFGAGAWVKWGSGDKSPLLKAIAPYLIDDTVRAFIVEHAHTAKVRFKDYDWGLNSFVG